MPGTEQVTLAAALLDRLAAHGVSTAYGIPGVHNLPFWEAAGLDGRPRVVGVRHEQAAGYAADALARSTGGIGVALTTTGPGFANALAAFGEAYAALSPVLLLSSEAPLGPRRTSGHDDGVLHGMRSQAAAVREGFGAAAVSVRDPATAVEALDSLVAGMRATGRPAYLGVPADLLGAPVAPSPATAAAPGAAPVPPPDPAVVAAALEGIRGRRVVMWLGTRAIDHEDAVAALAARLGARVVTTFGARGLLASYAGSITAPPHEPRVAAAIAAAETLLVVGDELAGMTTRNWTMPVPATIVAITDDAGLSLGDYPLAARVVGDVGACLRALLDGLDPAAAIVPPVDDLTPAVLAETGADPRTADGLALVDAVARAWPDDGVVVADMCVAGYWLAGYSRQPRPRRLLYPVGWGTLGFALPAAIGPASAGRPTLVVTGDGGAAMALGELATIAQERLPVAVLVVADGGYGMLRYDQQVAGADERGVDLLEPRWSELAAAFGFAHREAAGIGVLTETLTAAYDDLADERPSLVVLRAALHPPRTTSPRWREG